MRAQVHKQAGGDQRGGRSPSAGMAKAKPGVFRRAASETECWYLVTEARQACKGTTRHVLMADVLVFAYSNKYSINVHLMYSFRLYPSPGQQQALADLDAAYRNFFASRTVLAPAGETGSRRGAA